MLTLSAGPATCEVDPSRGGRLVRLAVDGFEVLRTPEESAEHFGAFPMAPWAGRVRGGRFRFEGTEHDLPLNAAPHAIHGTVRDHPWAVVDGGPSRATMTCALGPGWPWDGWAEQVVEVHDDRLALSLSVHSRDEPFPASAGWHPWFRRDGVELDLDAGAMYERDADHIATRHLVPVRPGPWDDCFTGLRHPPRLQWPGGRTLTIESSCPCVVVFSEPLDTICVEPQTAPPDALGQGDATIVRPGAPLVASTTWRWE